MVLLFQIKHLSKEFAAVINVSELFLAASDRSLVLQSPGNKHLKIFKIFLLPVDIINDRWIVLGTEHSKILHEK